VAGRILDRMDDWRSRLSALIEAWRAARTRRLLGRDAVQDERAALNLEIGTVIRFSSNC
jgi:hypothetical protein